VEGFGMSDQEFIWVMDVLRRASSTEWWRTYIILVEEKERWLKVVREFTTGFTGHRDWYQTASHYAKVYSEVEDGHKRDFWRIWFFLLDNYPDATKFLPTFETYIPSIDPDVAAAAVCEAMGMLQQLKSENHEVSHPTKIYFLAEEVTFDFGEVSEQNGVVKETVGETGLSVVATAGPASHEVSLQKRIRQMELLLGKDGEQVCKIANSEGLSTDEKLRQISRLDRRFLSWTSDQWATLLGVTSARIRQIYWWKHDRKQEIERG
jgi:hypothetical protein